MYRQWFYFKHVLVLMSCLAVHSQVVNDRGNGTILVKEGDDITLPCQVDTRVNPDKATVEWARLDLVPRYVYLLQDGLVARDLLNPLYKDRTSVSAEDMSRGNLSMRLSSARLSDEGRYKCNVPNLSRGATIQLNVGKVSEPVILWRETEGGGKYLVCDSGCWYPEPEMSLLYTEGQFYPGKHFVLQRDPGTKRCYVVHWTITVLQAGTVMCIVRLKHINYTLTTRAQVPAPGPRAGATASTSGHLVDAEATRTASTDIAEGGAQAKESATVTYDLRRASHPPTAYSRPWRANGSVGGHTPGVNYTLEPSGSGGGTRPILMRAQLVVIAIACMLLTISLGVLGWARKRQAGQVQTLEIVCRETLV